MSKLTLSDLSNLQNETTAVAAINANAALIETAIENTLSRDGTSPNTMSAALDMNSNQIYNLPAPSTTSSPARLIDVVSNPTITIPGTGTSGHTVPFLDGDNTWSGTNAFGTTTFTKQKGCSVYLPNSVTGIPSESYFQVAFGATSSTLYNDSTVWDTTLWKLQPPNGVTRCHVDFHIFLTAGVSSSSGASIVAKFIRNPTINGSFVLTGGTDVKALIGNISTTIAGSGSVWGGFDFSHTDGDKYGLFLFVTSATTVTMDGNVAHTWLTARTW